MSIAASTIEDSASSEMRLKIESEVVETLAAMQQKRAKRVGDHDLAWLALVPVWTLPIANKADFHGGGKALEEFLVHAEALGVVVRQRPGELLSGRVAEALQRNIDHQFWMPEAERSRVLTDLRDRLGPSVLLGHVSTIVSRLPSVTRIPALDQWRELAMLAVKEIGPAAEKLHQVVRELLEHNESGAALSWLRTGALLAQALGGQLESAVMRGGREVEVAYRRAHDRRALAGFLEREAQIRAFAELVEGPDDGWALHFLGVGGAGKTMLIRHINAELAARHERITARVDFDYISPNYPLVRPEQLLVELADELRAYSAPEEFARFDDRVRSLQDKMSQRTDGILASDPLERPEFQALQRAFSDWLAKLPSKVVLILDTCEELAKLQPGGEMAPNIRATYRILEDLHEANPSLRVIFAGRRPLALSGRGWQLRKESLPEGRRHLPEKKDYLRLHLIRGFTDSEADEYFRRQQVSASGELRAAILKNSRESPAIVDLIEGAKVDYEARSNPFDLSLYVQWLRETPDLTANVIRSGRTDPYVDLRIARRLTDSVRELLPAVAFLGRFDEAMLRPAAPLVSDTVFADIFRELAEQEWIDYQHDDAGSFLQVDRNLHPRLLGYFTANLEQCRLFDHARQQLAPGLAQLLHQRLPSIQPRMTAGPAPKLELGFELVHAALRALDAVAASDLWEEIEARVIATGRWDWASTITGRLLGEQDVGRIEERLRPAIMATQASAMLHMDAGPAVAEAWENVIAAAGAAHPAERAQAIQKRAWLGKIAASPEGVITPFDVSYLTGLWKEQLDDVRGVGAYSLEQVAAALYAATETIVDKIESDRKYGLLIERIPVTLSVGSISPELYAFGFTLSSRLHRAKGHRDESEEAARNAIEVARAEQDQPAQRWAGWSAPDSIEDFAQLERLLHFRWFAEADALLERWPGAEPRAQNLDAERLLSLHLELQLGKRLVDAPDLEKLEVEDRYTGPRRNERAAHRAVAPLVVNLALGWLALGDSERALTLLDTRIQAVKSAGPDPQMILQCEQAKLRVITRMRLQRRGETLMTRSLQTPELATLGWPARALNGLPSPELPAKEEPTPRALIHAWWRSRTANDLHSGRAISKAAKVIFKRAKGGDDFSAVVMLADYRESELCDPDKELFRSFEQAPRIGEGQYPTLKEAIDKLRAESAAPSRELVRLTLRLNALGIDRTLWGRELVGRRRLAELALEEGELLGLRLPDPAMELLEFASEEFVAVEDWVGALIAGICGDIAAGRGGMNMSSSHLRLREKVRLAYEHVLAAGAGELPSWQKLESLAEGGHTDLSCLDHSAWGGWLHRLFRWLFAGRAGKKNMLIIWLARHYGEHLPEELGFSEEEKRIARKGQRTSRGEDRFIRVAILSTLILFLPSIASIFGFIKFTGLGLSLTVVPWIIFYLASIVALTAKMIAAWGAARRHFAIIIDPAGGQASGDLAKRLPCQLRVQMSDPKRRISAAEPYPTKEHVI